MHPCPTRNQTPVYIAEADVLTTPPSRRSTRKNLPECLKPFLVTVCAVSCFLHRIITQYRKSLQECLKPFLVIVYAVSCFLHGSLCDCDLANENPETAKQNFLQHVYTSYNDCLFVYTDGSKTDFGTSSSFYVHRFEVRRAVKLNTNASKRGLTVAPNRELNGTRQSINRKSVTK